MSERMRHRFLMAWYRGAHAGRLGRRLLSEGASQAEVIMRLDVRNQESSFDQGDVTSGKVYGLGYRWAGSSKVWSLDKFKTGFDGMTTRQPEHL